MKKYSAGTTSKQLWFPEFKKVITYLCEGKSIDEIKQINLEENIFNARSQRRSKEIMNSLIVRIRHIDQEFLDIFTNSSLDTQKTLALILHLVDDRLFFEFINEVIKDRQLLGYDYFLKKDINNFFELKKEQDETIDGWIDTTIYKLGQAYKVFLIETGIIKETEEKLIIQKPLISMKALDWIKSNQLEPIYYALIGENQ